MTSPLHRFASMVLADGRHLAWREYGTPSGFPVIFFHGNLNSRIFQPMWNQTSEATKTAGARVIAIDRPGYGNSTYHPDRSYSSCADDTLQLANHLRLPQFAVLGYSSGGPCAMSCAVRLSSRIAGCGLICPDGPYRAISDGMVQQMFGSDNVTQEYNLQRTQREYKSLIESYTSMSKPDRKELALADIELAAAQGLDKGPTQDGLLESSPWDFDVKDLGSGDLTDSPSMPVLLWHGVDDDTVPISVARWISHRCPAIRPAYIEGESHSMIRRRWKTILDELLLAVREQKSRS